jgi:hypothetical protein
MELVCRITTTERPGYEPDGDGFARLAVTPHGALFNFALGVNAREQEKKAMADEPRIPDRTEWQKQNMEALVDANEAAKACIHGLIANCGQCGFQAALGRGISGLSPLLQSADNPWAPPETLTAKLTRLRFQLQTTQQSLSELQREVEEVMAGL